mgnify:CR=1 FL=1
MQESFDQKNVQPENIYIRTNKVIRSLSLDRSRLYTRSIAHQIPDGFWIEADDLYGQPVLSQPFANTSVPHQL